MDKFCIGGALILQIVLHYFRQKEQQNKELNPESALNLVLLVPEQHCVAGAGALFYSATILCRQSGGLHYDLDQPGYRAVPPSASLSERNS